MGRTKALLPIGQRSFLANLVAIYRSAGLEEVVAVGGADYAKIAKAVPDGCRLVEATDWASGMRASLRAGLKALSEGPVLLTHVDRPRVAISTVQKLLNNSQYLDCTRPRIPCYHGALGHPVYLPAYLRERLLQEDDQPLNQILEAFQPVMVEVEDPDVLLNVNTPEDWRAIAGSEKLVGEVEEGGCLR